MENTLKKKKISKVLILTNLFICINDDDVMM